MQMIITEDNSVKAFMWRLLSPSLLSLLPERLVLCTQFPNAIAMGRNPGMQRLKNILKKNMI